MTMPAHSDAPPAPPLIGRDAELEELARRLRASRLLTVIGPGGVGKTALAQRAAEQLAPKYPGGRRDVDLTRLTTDDTVPAAVAVQLGYRSWDGLLLSLAGRPTLVVVDNCEHVLDAAAAAVSDLLRVSPTTSVLATSRSPLELPGESVLSLAPLAVPDELDADPMSSPACRLFLDRARQAGAVVGDADADTVVRLCHRLDGLPLAIEIAAARTRTMSVAEITARLGDGLEVLRRPRFHGPPRHRSISDTITWSSALLSPPAAALLDQLAVFNGPFGAADAQGVAETALAADVAESLQELVDLSLVVTDTTGPLTRYRLLDTVRRFALARLDATGRRAAAFDRFADHALALALEAFGLGASGWDRLLPHLDDSFDTLREALRWCLEHDDGPERAMTLCAVLWPVGRYTQTLEPARRVFARWPHAPQPLAAAAAVTLAYGETDAGSPHRAVEIAAAQLAALSSPSLTSVMLHRVLGHARLVLGDVRGAASAFRDGAEIARGLGLVEAAIDLVVSEAEVAAHLGEVDDALRLLDGARRDAAAAGSRSTDAAAAAVQAWVLVLRDGPAAADAVTEALALARDLDHRGAIIVDLRSLFHLQLVAGDLRAAASTMRSWLDAIVDWGLTSDARNLVGAAAMLAHRAGHDSWAALAATHRVMPGEHLPADLETSWVPRPDDETAPLPPPHRLAAVAATLAGVDAMLTGRPEDVPDGSGSAGAAPDRQPTMRLAGDVWEIDFDRRRVTVRSSKGLADIATLLARPGREVHCLDLMGAVAEQHSTGEVIDAAARRGYEERIRDLQDAVDEAEGDNDFVRAERAQTELDAVVAHLAAALGHGRRTRRAGDSAERARSAVTQRIRGAIRQLGGSHPSLGRHLQASVRTGLYCSYQPERPITWAVMGPGTTSGSLDGDG